MTNFLQDGDVWLDDQLAVHAGRIIRYVRGANTSGDITAVSAEIEYEVLDHDGYATKLASRDYWIQTADIVLNGVVVAPRAGDRIRETINGIDYYFGLIPIGTRPVAELLGDGLRYKVHTKRVE